MATDPREPQSLGEVLHRARQAGGEQRPRPWPVEPWADRDPRLKELDEAMAAAVAAVVRERFRAALREHYLAGITCDGAQERDNPVCGCSRVFLGWHPSVGEAREAWIRHVLGVVDGDKISDEKEASQP